MIEIYAKRDPYNPTRWPHRLWEAHTPDGIKVLRGSEAEILEILRKRYPGIQLKINQVPCKRVKR